MSRRRLLEVSVVAAVFLLPVGGGMAQDAVRIGVFPSGGPFTLFGEATKDATGATVEILEALAEDAGLMIEWVPIEGSGSNPMVAAIEADQIDLIAYPFQMTDARQEQYDFTDPIFAYGETVIVQSADEREYGSAADLKGRSVGVVEGSNFVDIANSVGADTREGPSLDAAIDDVNAGRIDAVMGTAPVLIYRVQQGTWPEVRIPSEYRSESPVPAGLGVKKGNSALLETLNAGLEKLTADGTIQEISAQWAVQDLVAK
jgi:polar amino acid transport system substrate-binding protein